MKTQIKHYVTFLSPGSFCAEQTTKPITLWDTTQAVQMASAIKERHGATPYGFRFETYREAPPVKDDLGNTFEIKPLRVQKSGTYYINGKVETLAEVEARATQDDRILVANMRCNEWPRIVTTKNGYSWCQPLYPGDKVVDGDGSVTWEEP